MKQLLITLFAVALIASCKIFSSENNNSCIKKYEVKFLDKQFVGDSYLYLFTTGDKFIQIQSCNRSYKKGQLYTICKKDSSAWGC